MWLWSKLGGWVVGIGSVLLTVGGAVLYGWEKGRKGAQAIIDKAAAKQKVNTVNAIEHRAEERRDVDNEVAKLPASPVVAPVDASTQPVSGSAADKLQSDWSRD